MISISILLTKGEVDKVISILFKKFYENKMYDDLDKLIVISASWNNAENSWKKGLVSRESYNISYSRTVDSLTDFILGKEVPIPSVKKVDPNKSGRNFSDLTKAFIFIVIPIFIMFMTNLIYTNHANKQEKTIINDQMIITLEILENSVNKNKQESENRFNTLDEIAAKKTENSVIDKQKISTQRNKIIDLFRKYHHLETEISNIIELKHIDILLINNKSNQYIYAKIAHFREIHFDIRVELKLELSDYENRLRTKNKFQHNE